MILLVDDQEFNLNAIEIILKYKLKVNVEKSCVRATSGAEAIEIIKQDVMKNNYTRSSFTLILMDYEMPEMNGPETAHLIREFLYFEDITQPIIAAITGHSDQKFVVNAI